MSCLNDGTSWNRLLREALEKYDSGDSIIADAHDSEIQKLWAENEKLRAQLDMLIRILFDQIK